MLGATVVTLDALRTCGRHYLLRLTRMASFKELRDPIRCKQALLGATFVALDALPTYGRHYLLRPTRMAPFKELRDPIRCKQALLGTTVITLNVLRTCGCYLLQFTRTASSPEQPGTSRILRPTGPRRSKSGSTRRASAEGTPTAHHLDYDTCPFSGPSPTLLHPQQLGESWGT